MRRTLLCSLTVAVIGGLVFGAIGANLSPATKPPRFPQLTMQQLNEAQRPLGEQIMKISSVGLGGPVQSIVAQSGSRTTHVRPP